MNFVENCPIIREGSFFDDFLLAYSYGKKLESLAVGESIKYQKFTNVRALKEFARMRLADSESIKRFLLPENKRHYEHRVNEKDLTYTVERLD